MENKQFELDDDDYEEEPLFCEICGGETLLLEYGMCPMCFEVGGYLP